MVDLHRQIPLPDGIRDSFELSLQLPEKDGKTLAFPAVQSCVKGEIPWTEVADRKIRTRRSWSTRRPPFSITAAEEGGGHGDDAAVTESSDDDSATSAVSEDEGGNTLGAVGLGAGVLGLLAGGTALLRVRRRG